MINTLGEPGHLEFLCGALSRQECAEVPKSWNSDHRRELKPKEIFLKILEYTQNYLSSNEANARASEKAQWIHSKYGVRLDLPLLAPVNPQEFGTYRSSFDDPLHEILKEHSGRIQDPHFEEATLSPLFDPLAETSLQNVEDYVRRKWGGLQNFVSSDRLVFSDMGSHDTITALRSMGYRTFFYVNGAYAMRGSKTLLAYQDDLQSKPLVVFHSFVNANLFKNKLI